MPWEIRFAPHPDLEAFAAHADDEPGPMDHSVGGVTISQYTPATAQVILGRLARGESVDAILARPGMPSRRTLYDWLNANRDFSDAWALIRTIQARRRRRRAELHEELRALDERLRAQAEGRRPRAKRGRKSTYTRERAAAWAALVAAGATFRQAAAVPGMPAVAMIYRWLRNHAEFRRTYADAVAERQQHLELQAEDLVHRFGYASRPVVDRLVGRIGALHPDVWGD